MRKINKSKLKRLSAATGLAVFLTQILSFGVPAQATDVEVILREKPVSIQITPPNPTVHDGDTQEFTAMAFYNVSLPQDITNDPLTSWSSTNLAVATVSNSAPTKGLATAEDPGVAQIRATYGGVTGSTQMTVDVVVLTSIRVEPPAESINVENTQQFTATAVYSDASEADVTDDPGTVWTTSNGAVATVNNVDPDKGLVTGTGDGVAEINAEYGGMSDLTPAQLTVHAPLVPLEITPWPITIFVGQTQQFVAKAVFADGEERTITNLTNTSWNSLNEAVAIMSNVDPTKGRATAVSAGNATIGATYYGVNGSIVLVVEEPVLDWVEITPDPAQLNGDGTLQLTATGHLTDGSTIDLTDDAGTVWSSDDELVATIGANTGLAAGVAPGTVNIKVTIGAEEDTVLLTVNAPTSITVTPATATINIGQFAQYAATANFAVGDPKVITTNTNTTWSSSNAGVATVSNDTATKGRASGVAAGSTNIGVAYFGKSGTANLTVQTVVEPPGGGGGGVTPPDDDEEEETPPEDEEEEEEETPPEDEEEEEEDETPPEEDEEEEEEEDETPPEDDEEEEDEDEDLPPSTTEEEEEEDLPPATTEEEEEEEVPPGTTEEEEEEEEEEEPEYEEPDYSVPPPPPGKEEFAEEDEEEVMPVFDVPKTLEEHQILEEAFLPDEDSVTRGELLTELHRRFNYDELYKNYLDRCVNDLDACLSIFMQTTKFSKAKLDNSYCKKGTDGLCHPTDPLYDISLSQLYPDVPPGTPYYHEINLATMLNVVQGYYEEKQSPFLPYNLITRMEALKVILGAVSIDMIEWMYYPELEAMLGGPEGVKGQKTPFNDIRPTQDKMWWYPRYLAVACNVEMIDCTEGTSFRPDAFITENELQEMLDRLDAYLEMSNHLENIEEDDDNDVLSNYDEKTVYRTLYDNPDSDADKLTDGNEVLVYKTNPLETDSDFDLLGDYDEVVVHKTSPLKKDTDDDTFSDYIEIMAGTDPLDVNNYPTDVNLNGIEDEWEAQYGLEVKDGTQDTDRDGIADKMEYRYGTNPTVTDTDGDGISDADEIFIYKTNPLDPSDPGDLENLPVKITNFTQGQLVGDTTPLVQGIGPLGAEIRVLIRNDYGHERVLGSTFVDENYGWVFDTPEPIRDGRYQLIARALQPDKGLVTQSVPIHIVIDTTLNVVMPKPKKLADAEITEEVLLKNLRVKIKNDRPVLYGETEFGNEVSATWRSVVITSALIADSISGEFEIESPEPLDLGDHVVYVTATRRADEAQSETVKINFNVGAGGFADILRGVGEEEGEGVQRGGVGGTLGSVFEGIGKVIVPGVEGTGAAVIGLVLILGVIGAGGGAYYFFVLRKGKKAAEAGAKLLGGKNGNGENGNGEGGTGATG